MEKKKEKKTVGKKVADVVKKINPVRPIQNMVKKSNPKPKVNGTPYEQRENLPKLFLYVTIVNNGVQDSVVKLFESIGASMSFVELGQGTANKQVLDILGFSDNRKAVVFSVIKEEYLPIAREEIEAFFAASRKNRGIGFSIRVTSLIGVKFYRFLTDTI